MQIETINNIEVKLGYDRIRAQISAGCNTEGGRGKLSAETFTDQLPEVSVRLRLCDQMRSAMAMEQGFPGGEITDILPLLGKTAVEGSFLEVEEILLLRQGLETLSAIISFFKKLDENAYPDLLELTENIRLFPEVVNRIDTIADRHGRIKDSASPELSSIRKSIRDKEGAASRRINQILGAARKSGIIDPDATVSIRDGRAVIPVSAANKRRLPGFIHDESATGKTVFIEPVEVVEINNELKELEHEERREIVRILTEFTDVLRPEVPDMEVSADLITSFDMLRAKARFAQTNGCVMPILSDDGTLQLRKARHPLLAQTLAREGRELIPLDITLTREKHILVISGPNAGGKSVCLKTVGLLQWMLQCGMTVPVLENSQMPLFDRIFVDIGDDQSIDNDLSTYSSHLTKMKDMVRNAGPRSLVLIDEFGTGTEPVIGGAIAESILERLEARGCYGVITTHYSNLKYYASNAGGVVNGAMTFDVQNIRPLFRLEMGIPGSSFAIEIARKIGLPEDIIASASEKAGAEHVNIEKQLREIARDRRYWEQKRDRIRIADRKVEQLEERYGEQLEQIMRQRAEVLAQAREQARRLLEDANRQIETTIKEIRESQADKEKTRTIRRNIGALRERIENTGMGEGGDPLHVEAEMERIERRRKRREEKKQQRGDQSQAGQTAEPVPEPVREGGKVRMQGQDIIGEVREIKGKKATVTFGQILTTVPIERLESVSNTEYRKQARGTMAPRVNVSADVSRRRLEFRNNIDVRGMRASEALEVVADYIDDALMVGVAQVRILHGKGTGALKEEIRRYLRTVEGIFSAEDEHVDLGGAGITVVTFER